MSVVAAYHIFLCALFLVQGSMWTGIATHKYTTCCHNTHNNGILIILTRDFNLVLYVLPDDDMQCAIETCRSSESVLM